MTEFFYGVLFIALGLPLIEGVVSLYSQIINHICTSIAFRTQKKQKKIENEESKESTFAIGFQVPSNEEYYEDEDDK